MINLRNFSSKMILLLIFIALICSCKRPAVNPDKFGSPAEEVNASLTWNTSAKKTLNYRDIENDLKALMKEFDIRALSVAVSIDNNCFLFSLGIADPETQRPVDRDTVFRAASLGQPIFGYLIMRLRDEGVIELDKPIYKYLKRPLPEYSEYRDLKDDPRIKKLTARLILSHQSGLANSRRTNPDGRLCFNFNPGKQFGYSAEGYKLLQFVVEEITGRSISDLAEEKVFRPLSMTRTSFIWERRFDGNIAMSREAALDPEILTTKEKADVADSLLTNSNDYLKFLNYIITGAGLLSMDSWISYFTPEVSISSKSIFSSPKTKGEKPMPKRLSWCLGWGYFLSPKGDAYFQGGCGEGSENYAVFHWGSQNSSIVILGVTTNGKTFSDRILERLIDDTHSPVDWLEFRHKS